VKESHDASKILLDKLRGLKKNPIPIGMAKSKGVVVVFPNRKSKVSVVSQGLLTITW